MALFIILLGLLLAVVLLRVCLHIRRRRQAERLHREQAILRAYYKGVVARQRLLTYSLLASRVMEEEAIKARMERPWWWYR
jgi:hypothetical protein